MAAYGATNTTWSQSTLTYNNRPLSGTTVLGTVSVSGTAQNWYEMDLTNYLKAEKAAGRNTVTVVLKNLQTGDPFTYFYATESGVNRPHLVVT